MAEDLRTTKPHRRGITAGLRGKASPAAMHVLMVTYQGADLPSVAKEAELLRETWGSNVTILETSFAAKSEVLARLADRWDLIHFAGHGTFDGQDPWNSALHLTADPQSDSQRVTASDLLEVRLPQSPVVVLSACSSALAGGGPLNDAAGLVGALLRIGARGIVASRWPVYDQTALAFMKLFHSAVRRGTSAQASVREAQNALRSERGVEDWAAFSYIGAP
ncbi:CHAT domain-containing protein [Streptomyces sp. 3213.3]|uniref:CHAT domain-containing protein n=1 Tax=Streptomyces sp. 3213.3 TaxID=1855348 RepID=UPI00135BE070|nr:CHAT domain-containing protein [Streptomyces sp. 3213.3]